MVSFLEQLSPRGILTVRPTFTGVRASISSQKRSMPLRPISLSQFLAFLPKAGTIPDSSNRICAECSKIDFGFFAKESQRQPLSSGINLDYGRSIECNFCALLQHCLDQSGVVGTRLRGTLQGVHSGQELHLFAGDTRLEYSIQRCETRNQGNLDHFRHISDRYAPAELTTWLDKCDQHKCFPGDHESPICRRLTENFRLIDLERRCIVKPSVSVRYCALSYVWGSANDYFLTKDSERTLACDEGIDQIHHLPQTILDAMNLCRDIRCRYLWVDSLCIIQDDDTDRQHQIRSMAEIYSQSYLTIIAASGDDANSGLAPYGKFGRLPPTESLVVGIPGRGSFVASRSPQIAAANIIKSTWASRAWTLQEQILSRRVLFFAGAYVFLRCEYSLWNEDFGLGFKRNHFEHSEVQGWDLPLPAFYRRKSVDGHIYSSTFKHILGEYLRRQQSLTVPADILNAVTGILVRLKDEIGEHLWGLPAKRFAAALLWKSEGRCPSNRRAGFPSWSWAGWFHEEKPGQPCVDGRPHDIYGNGADDDGTNQSVLYCWGIEPKNQNIFEIERPSIHSIYFQLKGTKASRKAKRDSENSSLALLNALKTSFGLTPTTKVAFKLFREQIGHTTSPDYSTASQHLLIWASCVTLYVDERPHRLLGTSGGVGCFFLRARPGGNAIGVIDLALEWRESQKARGCDAMEFLATTAGIYPSLSHEVTDDVLVRVMMIEPLPCSVSENSNARTSYPGVYRRIQISLIGISISDWAECYPESRFVVLT